MASFIESSVSPAPAPLKDMIDTNGHCFICLKEPTTFEMLSLSMVKESTLTAKEIEKSFKSLVCYLAGFRHDLMEVMKDEKNILNREEENCRNLLSLIGDHLPALCLDCYDSIAELGRLHLTLMETQKKIKLQTLLVREYVLKTRKKMKREDKTALEQFLETTGGNTDLSLQIHDQIFSAGSSTVPVTFPSHAPPSSPSSSPPSPSSESAEEVEEVYEEEENEEKMVSEISPPPMSPIPNVQQSTVPNMDPLSDPKDILSMLSINLTADPLVNPPLPPPPKIIQQPSSSSVSSGMNVCGVPVDPNAKYVMVTTQVADPVTGAVTMQPILLDVAQLQTQAQVQTSTAAAAAPTPVPILAPTPYIAPPKPPRKRKSDKGISKMVGNNQVPSPVVSKIYPGATITHSGLVIYQEDINSHPCDVCNEQIPRGPDVVKHLQTHVSPDYVFYCDECHCGFISSFRLVEYHRSRKLNCKLLNTPGIPISKCDMCDFQTWHMVDYRMHMKEHQDMLKVATEITPIPFKCPICPMQFQSRKMVELHLNDLHVFMSKACGRQRCDVCGSIYFLSELEAHFTSIHGIKNPIYCKLCVHIVSDLEALIKHLRQANHQKVCHVCDNITKFCTNSDLRIHYFEEHGIGSKFICEICNEEFFSKPNWQKHMERIHSKSTPQDPLQPSTSTSTSSSVSVPAKTEQSAQKPKKKIKVNCAQCDIILASKESLLKHQMKVHNHPPLKCNRPGCEETFGTERDRKLHVLRKHKGFVVYSAEERLPFTCDQCEMGFATRGILNRHKSTKHTTEKPFVCELCEATYKTRSGLRSHNKTTHLKVQKKRNFVCDVCGTGFYNGKMLKNHKLIHSGERPYACQHCGQRFRQLICLRTHERSHEQLGDKFRPKGEMERNKNK